MRNPLRIFQYEACEGLGYLHALFSGDWNLSVSHHCWPVVIANSKAFAHE